MVVKWKEKLTWKSGRKNGVNATTLKSRPTISCIRKMYMEQGNSGDPCNQPRDTQEV